MRRPLPDLNAGRTVSFYSKAEFVCIKANVVIAYSHTSSHTGAGDLFTDGVEGFIVPPRSVDDLVSRLEQLAQDPTLRERMSESALDRVASIGGWDDYGERWAQRLQEGSTK